MTTNSSNGITFGTAGGDNLYIASGEVRAGDGNDRPHLVWDGSIDSTAVAVAGEAGDDQFYPGTDFSPRTFKLSGGTGRDIYHVEHVEFSDGAVDWSTLFHNQASKLGDVLTGTSASDELDGLGGDDTMTGEGGDDRYTVDALGDVIVELAEGGTDSVSVGLASGIYQLGACIENAHAAGEGPIGLTGNELDNILRGNDAVNTLNGGAGSDTLNGGLGNDKFTSGAGSDRFVLVFGNDTITDFGKGDRLVIAGAIGNGDKVIDGAVTLAAPGAFSADAELVIVSQTVASPDDGERDQGHRPRAGQL